MYDKETSPIKSVYKEIKYTPPPMILHKPTKLRRITTLLYYSLSIMNHIARATNIWRSIRKLEHKDDK